MIRRPILPVNRPDFGFHNGCFDKNFKILKTETSLTDVTVGFSQLRKGRGK
jgi:hypothetical protein